MAMPLSESTFQSIPLPLPIFGNADPAELSWNINSTFLNPNSESHCKCIYTGMSLLSSKCCTCKRHEMQFFLSKSPTNPPPVTRTLIRWNRVASRRLPACFPVKMAVSCTRMYCHLLSPSWKFPCKTCLWQYTACTWTVSLNWKIPSSSGIPIISVINTVKLVYKDHHRDEQNVVLIHRWPLCAVKYKVYPSMQSIPLGTCKMWSF